MLLYLGNELLRVVRMRPLVSVVVSGDRYSVGYSGVRLFEKRELAFISA